MPDQTAQSAKYCKGLIYIVIISATALMSRLTEAQTVTARVMSVTQETSASIERPQVCWQSILTAHQKALREEQNTPWLIKNWQPILGAALGGAIGYGFTANYGESSQKWIWPTVAGGAAVGAIAGPGATAGAYGMGTLAYSLWPASLPLTAGFSLMGGILGKVIWDMIFPANPDLQAPQPGQFMSNQTFFLETTCTKPERIEYRQSAYLITYMHQGKKQSARVKYYPGARIELTTQGRPIYELADAR